ncbi:MAG: ATP-binding protein [Balneolaceae bacterium]
MSSTFRLTLPSTFEESEKVPDFVSDSAAEAGLNEELTSTLMLLASEAVSNAMEHGNDYDPDKNVHITVQIATDKITCTVRDEGSGFDPGTLHNPLDENHLLDEGGRGIFLIQELADTVEFKENGRVVEFVLNRS